MTTSFRFCRPLGLAFLLALPFAALAQTSGVGIGTTAPDASAALDIVSSSKGALLPRLTAAQRLGMAAPAAGLIVFQSDAPTTGTGAGTSTGFWFNAGTGAAPAWQRLADSRDVSYSPAGGLAVGGTSSATYGTFNALAGNASPFHGEALGTRTAFFMSAAALSSAGLRADRPITSLGLLVYTKSSTGPFNNFTVQLGNTTTNTTSTGTDPTDPLTTVFTGSVTTVVGLNTLAFTTPYKWDGTSGLYLEFCFSNAATVATAADVLQGNNVGTTSSHTIVGTNVCAANYAFSASGNLVLVFGQGVAYTLPAAAGTAGQVLTQQADGSLTFASQPWTQTGASIYPTTLTSNVGIGTTSPSQKLEVAGGIKFTGTGNALTFPDGTTQTSAAVATATNFIQNTTTQQASANFNVAGSGTVGTDFVVNGANTNTGSIANGLRFGGSSSGEGLGSKRTATGNVNGLDFYTNSTNRLAITNGGSVGIGTTTPPAKLTVQLAADTDMGLRVTNGAADGTGLSGNIVLQTLTGSNSGFSFLGFNGYNSPGEQRFNTTKNRWRLGADQRGIDEFFLDTWNGTTGTSVLRATTAGNVGIGVSPSTKLEVAGVVYSNSGGFKFPDGTTQTTAATGGAAVTASNGLTRTGNDIALGGTLSGATTLATAGFNLNLTGSGNLGVGTSTPGQRLEVASATQSTATVNTLGLLRLSRPFTSGVKYSNAFDVNLGSYGTNINSQSQVDFRLANGATDTPDVTVLSLQGSGNVGIGTTMPNSRLSISPSTVEPKITLYDGGSTAAHYGLGVSSNQLNYHVLGTSDRHVFYATGKNGDGTELMRIQGNGNVGIGSNNPGSRFVVQAADNSTNPIANFQPQNLTQGVSISYNGIAKTGSNATSTLTLDGKSTGDILLHTNGSTGNVGIGTATPGQKLEVAGGIKFTGTGSVLTFPDGTTQATAATGGGGGAGDNLGNHTATQALNLGANALTGTGSSITGVGVGVTAAGGLNLGQNGAGNNIFVGYQAGVNNAPNVGASQGVINQFIGYQAGINNTTGKQNLFVGYQSGAYTTTGGTNQFIGLQSGFTNTTGTNNTFSGAQSGYLNDGGNQNVFTGVQSGLNNASGSNNAFYGTQSGQYNTSGGSNSALGTNSGPASGSGALTNTTAIGAGAVVSQSNSVVLGNAANVGIGTSAPATRLDVNGNLRLAVRNLPTGPPPAATVLLGAADMAFSIYQTRPGPGNYVAGLRLPDAATGLQVPGQQFTIINSSTESTLAIEGTNTDNTAAVVLAAAGAAGVHGVMYVWSGSAWVRVQ